MILLFLPYKKIFRAKVGGLWNENKLLAYVEFLLAHSILFFGSFYIFYKRGRHFRRSSRESFSIFFSIFLKPKFLKPNSISYCPYGLLYKYGIHRCWPWKSSPCTHIFSTSSSVFLQISSYFVWRASRFLDCSYWYMKFSHTRYKSTYKRGIGYVWM